MTADAPLVVAVSGGIDSVVMLDMFVSDGVSVIVAHANHGIRTDSAEDEVFVRQLAASYGVPFVSTRLNLGAGASEDRARSARYAWLETVVERYGASGIATGHHQDDVIETIAINIARGTGWRGLSSLRSTPRRQRPLLAMTKVDIVGYATERNLQWREDSTNESMRYLRNRLRQRLQAGLTQPKRQRLYELYTSQLRLRKSLETEVSRLAAQFMADEALYRYPLIMVDEAVGLELVRYWLGQPLETKRFHAIHLFAKTARPGARYSLDTTRFIVADQNRLIVLSTRD